MIVDVLGLMLAVVVHGADIQDRDGAKLVMAKVKDKFPRLKLIWGNGGYAGQLIAWMMMFGQWVLEIIKRNTDLTTFVVLPRRWIVERTFGWLSKYRRLSKDYESLPSSSEAMIQLAMINLMVHRLERG